MKRHWLETVVALLTAETSDLRALARLANADPETFYRETSLECVETRGQDLSGMAFSVSNRSPRSVEYDISEITSVTVLSAFGNAQKYTSYIRIGDAEGTPVFGYAGVILPIGQLETVVERVRHAREQLGLRKSSLSSLLTVGLSSTKRGPKVVHAAKELFAALQELPVQIVYAGYEKQPSPRTHSAAAVLTMTTKRLCSVLERHFERERGSTLLISRDRIVDWWVTDLQGQLLFNVQEYSRRAADELYELADFVSRVVYNISIFNADSGRFARARFYNEQFGYQMNALGIADSGVVKVPGTRK